MATWPSTLPEPLAPGYGLDAGEATVRTDMDGGAARVRRRCTAIPDKVSLKFLLTEAQMVIFRAFYDADMQQGAAWVFIPVKTGRSIGVSNLECRPTSPFKFALVGKCFAVELPVEVRSA